VRWIDVDGSGSSLPFALRAEKIMSRLIDPLALF